MDQQKKNKTIFIIAFFVFLAIVIAFSAHFMSMTTSPWTKKKFDEKYRVK